MEQKNIKISSKSVVEACHLWGYEEVEHAVMTLLVSVESFVKQFDTYVSTGDGCVNFLMAGIDLLIANGIESPKHDILFEWSLKEFFKYHFYWTPEEVIQAAKSGKAVYDNNNHLVEYHDVFDKPMHYFKKDQYIFSSEKEFIRNFDPECSYRSKLEK